MTCSRAGLCLAWAVALGCASYGSGNLNYKAHPELGTVMLLGANPNPVGAAVATVETKQRGGRNCSDLGTTALGDLLDQARARGAHGVKDVQFRGRSKWVGDIVCRSSTFGRSAEARGTAYSLGKSVPIPRPRSIAVPAGLHFQFTEMAILAAAVDEAIPDWVSTHVQPASLPVETLKVKWMAKPHGSGWFPESRKVGQVFAEYRQVEFRLRVRVDYDRETVTARIAGSRNLGQTATHISSDAATRFGDFVARIQSRLTDLARRR